MSENYKDYLNSEAWKIKKLRCCALAENKCEICESGEKLTAHHYNYFRLGEEEDRDLFCLCNVCHWLYHKKFPANKLPNDISLPRGERLQHLKETLLKMGRMEPELKAKRKVERNRKRAERDERRAARGLGPRKYKT